MRDPSLRPRFHNQGVRSFGRILKPRRITIDFIVHAANSPWMRSSVVTDRARMAAVILFRDHGEGVCAVPSIDPLLALGVVLSTMATDAAYVLFNAAVSDRRRVGAATWSSIWYLLSAFAVISYTTSWVYVLFAAAGSWIGAFLTMTWLRGR